MTTDTETDINMTALADRIGQTVAVLNGERSATDTPPLGIEAGEKLRVVSVAAAADVAKLGQAVRTIAEEIGRECDELAQTIQMRGNEVAGHIAAFAALAKEVALANRATRMRITGEETH